MQLRVINLDRTPERLRQFMAANRHVPGITRFPGVDGQTLDQRDLLAKGVILPDLGYGSGALGAALSHLMQWNGIRAGNAPVTVLEDDAILCGNFMAESTRLLQTLPADWDMILWGYNFDTPLTYDILPGVSACLAHFNQETMRRAADTWPERVVASAAFPLMRTLGLAGYAISPAGAEKLFQFCTPLRPMRTEHPGLPVILRNTGIDNMMANHWMAMKAYVAVPALVLTKNERGISTVQEPGPTPLDMSGTNPE